MRIRTFLSIVAVPVLLIAGPALGDPPDHVSTPADVIHPNIHQNVGGGNNANPNGVSPTGGANLHGIGNTPGQSDTNPNDDGVAGFANQLTNVHGGIDSKNKNAIP